MYMSTVIQQRFPAVQLADSVPGLKALQLCVLSMY